MTAFGKLAGLLVVLALVVVVLGAWVRLTDAGLGCTDWPGCYGQLLVPDASRIPDASVAYPERLVESGKAWREMIHRYAAGLFGLGVFAIGALVASSVLIFTALLAFRHQMSGTGLAIGAALAAQIAIGITMVQGGLPLGLATAHNAVAALFLLSVVTLNHKCWQP